MDVKTNITLKMDIDVLFWKFRTSVIVVKYPPKVTFVGYEGRAEIIEGNFSLLLKNLQEGDSGCYTAVVSGDKDTNVATYMLVVQERVEPPVLTVDSVCSINGTCNVTVTCRGQNTSVTSICNNSTCSQVGGESRGAETSTVPLLSVYVAGGSIICNHSNQVSWANDTKEIMELCPMTSGNYNSALTVWTPVGVAGFGGTAALIGFILWRKQKKRGKEEIISTDYATVMTPDNSQAGGEEQVSPGPGPALPTIYSLVGPQHPQPVNHQPPPVDLPMSTMPPMPESLYAVVGKKTSKQ
ncbi:hypothetical protein J4Q44_G00191850 [Coregonus suidteri]|uniref:Immunoglobulin subtype domain-containing protein n=1 Tax=Coregonus suidteri TaxID=861788 RepID=A0AAN8LH26_9TELE